MRSPLLKLLFLLLCLSKNLIIFSQKDIKGTYHLVMNPSDAPSNPDNEFPIYSNRVTLKLKGSNKFENIVTDLVGGNRQVTFGKWSIVEKKIRLEFQVNDTLETHIFEIVALKSGSYIKPINSYFDYYKKE